MKIGAFDWDAGNWPKCGKHGVSREEIEQVFLDGVGVKPDPHGSEERLRAIAETRKGRYVFVVFTLRWKGEVLHVRPVSARYMHMREVKRYDES